MRFWCGHAWLPDGVRNAVLVETRGGRIASVDSGVSAPDGAIMLPGVTLPGFANVHSHAFHRALRGRTHGRRGTFDTWRDQMYAVAARLDPDRYYRLALATYAEMVLAGVTSVGEFHYLHHGPGGVRYDDPNAMGEALRAAAAEAGVRLTLLDTLYLTGGIGEPLSPAQARFSDGSATAWAARVADLRPDGTTRIGVAAHSVRAVPAADLRRVAEVGLERPLHIHLSEQPAENDACQAAYGLTPTGLLAERGLLGPGTTVVHATHLADSDIVTLGATRTSVCFCPTTERDLGDGIGPARALVDEGASLCVGSDQHALVDLVEEVRAVELHERLVTGERGRFAPAELVDALTWRGHAALGWPEAGRIEPGAAADLVAVRLDTPRTAGVSPAQVVLAATAADIDTVVVDARVMVRGGRHTTLGDIGKRLAAAIAEVSPRAAARRGAARPASPPASASSDPARR